MNTMETTNETEDTNLSLVGIQNGIEYHKKIGEQLIAAATHHFKTASNLQEGSHERAAQSAWLAHEYFNLASETKTNGPGFVG